MSAYEDTFKDSTEHTTYTVKITSENGEELAFGLEDAEVRNLIEEYL